MQPHDAPQSTSLVARVIARLSGSDAGGAAPLARPRPRDCAPRRSAARRTRRSGSRSCRASRSVRPARCGCRCCSRPAQCSNPNAPNNRGGSDRITAAGSMKLSYCAASTSHTNTSASRPMILPFIACLGFAGLGAEFLVHESSPPGQQLLHRVECACRRHLRACDPHDRRGQVFERSRARRYSPGHRSRCTPYLPHHFPTTYRGRLPISTLPALRRGSSG